MLRMTSVRLVGAATLMASLLGTAAVHAQDTKPVPAAASETQLAEAKKQFEAGVALLDDPDGAKYEDAYRAFKKAYELSQSPKVLGNLAFCAMHMERDGEALDAYATYLKDVPEIEERERKQIQKDVQTMSATVAKLKVTVKREGTSFVLIDKREATRGGAVVNEYAFEGHELALRLRPGRHNLRVRAADEESDPVDVTIEPGASLAQEFKWTPKAIPGAFVATAPEKASYVGPVVLSAVGVAGIATGVVTGLLAQSKQRDIRENCQIASVPGEAPSICPRSYDLAGERSNAKTFQTLSNVMYPVGGALIAGGVIWGLINYRHNKQISSRQGSAAPSWLVGGMCGREGCSMNFTRGF